MDAVVPPVFHTKPAPLVPEAVRTEFPQLFATATDGAAGIATGAATPVPAPLIQPFAVCVTV